MQAPYFEESDQSKQIRRNLVHQLHSLRRLRSLVEFSYPEGFDLYCLLRPDLQYESALDLDIIRSVASGRLDIAVPRWQAWGGLNDRFCIASRRGFEAYTARWALADAFIQERGYIHAEKLLEYAVLAADLKQGLIETKARRVRANGRVHDEWEPVKPSVRLARSLVWFLRRLT